MKNAMCFVVAFALIGCSNSDDNLFFKNDYHELMEFQGDEIDLTMMGLVNGDWLIQNSKKESLCDSIGRFKTFKSDRDFFKFMERKGFERTGWDLQDGVATYRFRK